MDPVIITVAAIAFFVFIAVAFGFALSRFYRKVGPEEALIRSGSGGLAAVTGAGMWVIPILHRVETMDLSVKRIEIARSGAAGLICRDNIRADIEVAFFVRVNNTREDILQVAQSLGCARASDQQALVDLFDAKFSEALKTVGKKFDFVELYNERDKFKSEILQVIGTELNGYVLDDCAIDYLEQTPLDKLNPDNILDAEGIKKITELTAREHILSNGIAREKEKTIKKQDVEAREAILELERQRVEAEEKQKREVAAVSAREQAEAKRIQEENRLKAERARIAADEEIQVAEQNKLRQIIVAERNKQRTDMVENERVHKDREIEATDRERIVALAQIEKDKAIEIEKKHIQDVIRERVIVERAVVEQQEKIKDTEEFAAATRSKQVAVTRAEMEAQEALVKEVKAAEAAKQAAELLAQKLLMEAEAKRAASEKETQAIKMLAEAKSADHAAVGLAEARVMLATADATERQGAAEANVLERKALAEARGIEEKANAMKIFDSVGKAHEEFKLRLNKDKEVEIAGIQAQVEIAHRQSNLVAEALKSARIDIVGGETAFFDKIVDSIKSGKAVDRLVYNSGVLTDLKNTFFNGDPDYFHDKLHGLMERLKLQPQDVRDLSIAALIGRMLALADNEELLSELHRLLGMARETGMSSRSFGSLGRAKVEES